MYHLNIQRGKTHGGRIDTLGIDENGCPVIIEYKRSINENVINQGLFYLDWLLDHKGEFEFMVFKQLGDKAVNSIDWSSPRLVCIAGDFNKYDQHAVQQINRNIALIRYKKFGENLLLLELLNNVDVKLSEKDPISVASLKTVLELLTGADEEYKSLFESLKTHLMSMGDDVQFKPLKLYFAFRRLKNFACVELKPKQKAIYVYVKADLGSVKYRDGFTRDVSEIGHWGTGNLEIAIRSIEDIGEAQKFFEDSYEAN